MGHSCSKQAQMKADRPFILRFLGWFHIMFHPILWCHTNRLAIPFWSHNVQCVIIIIIYYYYYLLIIYFIIIIIISSSIDILNIIIIVIILLILLLLNELTSLCVSRCQECLHRRQMWTRSRRHFPTRSVSSSPPARHSCRRSERRDMTCLMGHPPHWCKSSSMWISSARVICAIFCSYVG